MNFLRAPAHRRNPATAALGRRIAALAALAALTAVTPLAAQYKVVGPDGKVTYTDRAPAAAQGKVVALPKAAAAAPTADAAGLPLELRQPASRYPVTLYVTVGACGPCDSARQLLRQRGVPHAEKTVQSNEDTEALERLSGGRDAPTLTIGTQTLRGLAPDVWGSYLDAAGYPRESKLPAGYVQPAATPLVEKREAVAPVAARAPAASPEPVTPALPRPGAGGIKF